MKTSNCPAEIACNELQLISCKQSFSVVWIPAHSLGSLLRRPGCSLFTATEESQLSFWMVSTDSSDPPPSSTLHCVLKLPRDSVPGLGWLYRERHCPEIEGGGKMRLVYPCPLTYSWSLQFGQVPVPKAMAPTGRPSPPASVPPPGFKQLSPSSQGVTETSQGPALSCGVFS